MEHGTPLAGGIGLIEDILLRTACGDLRPVIAHEIPSSPRGAGSFRVHEPDWLTDGCAYGGTAINSTFVAYPDADAAGRPPAMHKQAAWIPEFWPEGTEPGSTAPSSTSRRSREGVRQPGLGAGDQMVMFNDRPEVRLDGVLGHPGRRPRLIEGGGRLAQPERPADWYSTYQQRAGLSPRRTCLLMPDTMPPRSAPVLLERMIEWVSRQRREHRGDLRPDPASPAD